MMNDDNHSTDNICRLLGLYCVPGTTNSTNIFSTSSASSAEETINRQSSCSHGDCLIGARHIVNT